MHSTHQAGTTANLYWLQSELIFEWYYFLSRVQRSPHNQFLTLCISLSNQSLLVSVNGSIRNNLHIKHTTTSNSILSVGFCTISHVAFFRRNCSSSFIAAFQLGFFNASCTLLGIDTVDN